MSHPLIHYSNRLECLLQALVEQLLQHPYSSVVPTWIVVSCEAMGKWLLYSLQQKGLKTLGIRILLPHEVFGQWVPRFFKRSFPLFPSQMELALLLENLLPHLPGPAKNYLQAMSQGDASLNLGLHLASLFQEWSSEGITEGWPLEIWHHLCREHGIKPCLETINSLETLPAEHSTETLHFFAPSSFTRALWHLLRKMDEALPIFFYLHCPSALFFSDLRTERERQHLQLFWESRGVRLGERLALENFFETSNWFLANWGKQDRLLLEAFEATNWPSVSHYTLPESINEHPLRETLMPDLYFHKSGPMTALLELQSEIALLQPVQKKTVDQSIQIHQFTTLHQQYSTLKVEIFRLLENGLAPHEILILTPLISSDAPFLYEELKGLPLCIEDLKLKEQSPLLEAVLWLVHRITEPLCEKGKRADWLFLLHHKVFNQRAQFLAVKELHQLSQEQNTIFQEVRSSLITPHYQTAEDWVKFFTELFLKWLSFDGDPAAEYLLEQLTHFQESALRWQRVPLSKQVAGHFLETLLNQEEATLATQSIGGIRIASLLPGRLRPARALFLLNMNADAFPRSNSQPHFVERTSASPLHIEMSLFLHALLLAQDQLWISYCVSGPQQEASYLVKELYETLGIIPLIHSLPHPTLLSHTTFASPIEISCPIKDLSLFELRQAFKHPLKYYLEQVLQIEMPRSLQEADSIDSLDCYLAKIALLENTVHNVDKGSSSLLKKCGQLRIERECIKLKEQLQHFGIRLEDLHITPKESLQIPFQNQTLTIYGQLPFLGPQGVLSLTEKSKEQILQQWPSMLFYQMQQQTKSPKEWIFLPSQEKLLLNWEQGAWNKLLQVFFAIRKKPCPLHPDWVHAVAEKNEELLTRKIKEKIAPFERAPDGAYLWSQLPMKADQIIEEWHPVAKLWIEGVNDGI